MNFILSLFKLRLNRNGGLLLRELFIVLAAFLNELVPCDLANFRRELILLDTDLENGAVSCIRDHNYYRLGCLAIIEQMGCNLI